MERLLRKSKNTKDSPVVKKNSLDSIKARLQGNDLFNDLEHHDQIKHTKILALYSKSAAFAENNSEELALAYGNRSALLKHLKKYKECVIDVEKALSITKSEKLIEKLLARKLECLSLVEPDKDEEINNIPSINRPSKTIPCATEFVELKFDQKYGRHVVATENMKPGTVISIEKGYSFLNSHKIYLNCSYCLKLAWNGIPCEHCALAIYCSENCKNEAWIKFHDNECDALPYLFSEEDLLYVDLSYFIIALRILISCVKKEGLENIVKQAQKIDRDDGLSLDELYENGIYQGDKFKTLYGLSYSKSLKNSIQNLIPKSLIDSSFMNMQILKSYKNNEIMKASICKIFQKLMLVIINNVFSFDYFTSNKDFAYNGEEIKIAKILPPFTSLFNHSCEYNVGRAFSNDGLVLFTMDYVKKGQQLFVCYGASIQSSSSERKQMTWFQSQFVCDCFPCVTSFPESKNRLEYKKTMKKLEVTFKELGTLETFLGIRDKFDDIDFTKKHFCNSKKMLKFLFQHRYDVNYIDIIAMIKRYVNQYFCNIFDVKFDVPKSC